MMPPVTSSIELTDSLFEGRYPHFDLGSSRSEAVEAVLGRTDEADARYAPYSAWYMDYRGIEFYFNEQLLLKSIKVLRPLVGIAIPGSMGVDCSGSEGDDGDLLLFGKPVYELERVTTCLASLPTEFNGRVGAAHDGRSIHVSLENGERTLSANYVLDSRGTSDRTFDIDYHFEAIRIHLRGGRG